MGKTAGGAAAECKTDDRLANTAKSDLAAVLIVLIGILGRATVQEIQHLEKLLPFPCGKASIQTMPVGGGPPESLRSMVYVAVGAA